jgi:hypothetical protein
MAGHHRRKFHYFRNRNPAPSSGNLLLLAGIGVGAYFLYKQVKPDATVAVNGLGDVMRTFGAGKLVKRVRKAPRRIIKRAGKHAGGRIVSRPINGMEGLDGWGSIVKKVKKAVKKVASPVQKVATKVAPVVVQGTKLAVTAPLKLTREAVRPIDPLNKTVGKVLDVPLNLQEKAIDKVAGVIVKQPTAGSTGAAAVTTVNEYQDANGNPITEAEYNRLVALANQPTYQDSNGNTITKEQYDQLMAEYNASVTGTAATPTPNTGTNTGIVPGSFTQSGGAAAVTYQNTPAVINDTASSGGSSSSSSSSASPAEVQAAAPAAGGVSPLVAVGVAASVPLLFSAFG